MSAEFNANQAVREHVVNAVTLILDNDRGPYFRLTEVAQSAVAQHGTRRQFVDMLAGNADPDDWDHTRDGYAEIVGEAVRDELIEILEEENEAPSAKSDSLTYRLLIDVLDLHDSAQAAMFGDHYLPESADEIEWEEEEEAD